MARDHKEEIASDEPTEVLNARSPGTHRRGAARRRSRVLSTFRVARAASQTSLASTRGGPFEAGS